MHHYVVECRILIGILDMIFEEPVGPLCCLARMGVVPPSPQRAAFAAILYRTVGARLALSEGGRLQQASPELVELAWALLRARPALRALGTVNRGM